jgi:hypothetical protein
MRDHVDLPFPVRGLHDTLAGGERPSLTTEIMVNTPVRNPRTGEYTGARRAGIEKWVSERIGDGPVRGLIQVRFDARQTTYAAITDSGDLNIEWSRSNPAKESSQRIELDRAGNVFVLSGPTAVVKINPDGETVTQWEVPVAHKDQRLGVLIVDIDDAVYVATSTGPQGAVPKLWKYEEQEDGTYQIVWVLDMDGYMPDAFIKNGVLYVLENVSSKPLANGLPSNTSGVAYLTVFDSLGASEPRQLWYRAVPFPASMVRVNNAGVIYVSCFPNADRGSSDGDLCSPHAVWWTPSALSNASNRIWSWHAADDLAEGIGSLSMGDPVTFWRDRSNNGRNLSLPPDRPGILPPVYEPAGFCDLPVVRFNGTHGLTTTDTTDTDAESSLTNNLSLIPSVNNQAFTIFMVLAPRAGSANRQVVFEQWGEAKYRILVNDVEGTYTPDKVALYIDPVGDAASAQPAPGSIAAAVAPAGYRDDAVVLCFRMGGDDASESSFFRVNGVEVDRFTVAKDQIRYRSALGFSQNDGSSAYSGSAYEGDVAELLTILDVSGGISDAEIERIEGYLANKWGIRHVLGGSGSGSGSHPYRNEPPSGSGSAAVPEIEDPWALELSSTLGIVMALSPNAGEIRWAEANSGIGDVLAINELEDDGLVFCHGRSEDTGSGHGSTATASGDEDITTRVLRDDTDDFSYVWARSDIVIPRSTYFTRALMVGGAVYLPGHFQTNVTSLWKLNADTGTTIWTWDTTPIQRVAYDIAMPPAKDYGVDGLEDPEFFYLVTFQGGPGTDSSTIWKVRNVSRTVIDGNPRTSAVYASSEGDVRRIIPGASPEVVTATGGAAVLTDSRFIRGVQLFGELFINDGGDLFVVNPRTNVLTAYKPRTGGERLKNARLLAAWRGAIVEARPDDAPNQWQMSRRGDPYDQNRFPPVKGDSQAAILGSDSRAGLFPDLVNAIIPVTDDFCLFAGDTTIQQLTGDPMDAGVFDVIEPNVGIAFGYAWCIGPGSEVYFFSTQAEIRVLTVGSRSVELSKDISTRVKRAADLTRTTPILAFDTNEECLHVLFAPLDGEPETPTVHFRWEKRANAWSETTFQNAGHEPTSVCVLDGDDPEDRRVLIGCQDGYVRTIDRLAADDDGTGIAARVLIGPGRHPQFGQKIRLVRAEGRVPPAGRRDHMEPASVQQRPGRAGNRQAHGHLRTRREPDQAGAGVGVGDLGGAGVGGGGRVVGIRAPRGTPRPDRKGRGPWLATVAAWGIRGGSLPGLGGADPRVRRNAAGLTNEPQVVRAPLTMDKATGAMSLEPADAISELAAGASVADTVDKINQIVRALKAAGLMEK